MSWSSGNSIYSAFGDPRLDAWLRERGVGSLIVAGVYLHGCVRSTALDAYERGYEVCVADDAVGTTEPLHGEITRAWLAAARRLLPVGGLDSRRLDDRRGAAPPAPASALPVALIAGAPRAGGAGPSFAHRDPCRTAQILAAVPLGGAAEISEAAAVAAEAQRSWARTDAAGTRRQSRALGGGLETRRAFFADLLVARSASPAALRPRGGGPRRGARAAGGRARARRPPARSPPGSPRSRAPSVSSAC